MNSNLSHSSSYRRRLVLSACGALILIVLVGTFLRSRLPRAIGDVPAPVVQAVTNRNWGQVADLLNTVTPATASPDLRLLKAHACLAINKNNDALDLMSSVDTNDQMATWGTWTKELADAYPSSPSAIYLRGDALARNGDFNGAITEFTRSLGVSKNDAMVLTARGVAHAALQQDPTQDFEEAATADPKYADAQASDALMYLKLQDGATTALTDATAALDIEPDDALALFVRGWLELQHHERDKAVQDITNAARNKTVKTYIVASLRQLGRAFGGSGLSLLGANDNPGTSIIAQVVADDAENRSLSNPGVIPSTTGPGKRGGRGGGKTRPPSRRPPRPPGNRPVGPQPPLGGPAPPWPGLGGQDWPPWEQPDGGGNPPGGKPDPGGAVLNMARAQVNYGLLPITVCYGLEYDKRSSN